MKDFCVTILAGSYWRGLYTEGLIFGILQYCIRLINITNSCLKHNNNNIDYDPVSIWKEFYLKVCYQTS